MFRNNTSLNILVYHCHKLLDLKQKQPTAIRRSYTSTFAYVCMGCSLVKYRENFTQHEDDDVDALWRSCSAT
jgi:hypothetical protein